MKPSERRALKQQQNEQHAHEDYRTELSNQSMDENAVSGVKRNSDIDAKPRKEGFIQSHVRLITFIICMVLMLTVLGPWGIDMLVEKRNNQTVLGRKDISLESVYILSDNAEAVKWENLKNFNYTDYSYNTSNGSKYNVREYPIADSSLYIKAGGYNLSKSPDYIYLIDYKSGEYIDILKESAREFIISLDEETN